MTPFAFILTLVSFIYTLALTHVLMGAARMIRHRNELIFSWPHALWMAFTFLNLLTNWLALWDFRAMQVIDLGAFSGAVMLSVGLYMTSALVTPEFERPDHYDLVEFQKQQRVTYLTATLLLGLIALGLNAAAGAEGVVSWTKQNGLVLAMQLPILAALFLRNRLVQVVAPILAIVLACAFAWIFYPRIA